MIYNYFGARYYNSDISVWLSVDPMSDEYPSTSPFAYVENNPIMFIDPTGMFKDWYQNEEGQFLWAKKSEDAIDFNGKTYKNLNKGSNELPDDLKSDDGANLVVAGQNSDAFSTENDDWQSHADNVAKSGNNGKTNVLALVNNADELIEAFEHTSSQFGFIESAFIRSHAFGGTGFNDFGLNLGSTSQDDFGYNSIIKFNSKLKSGDIVMGEGAHVNFMGCNTFDLSKSFTRTTNIPSIGATGGTGPYNSMGMFTTNGNFFININSLEKGKIYNTIKLKSIKLGSKIKVAN